MRGRRIPAAVLCLLAGALCFLAGDLATSAGFSLLVCGCGCWLAGWLLFWGKCAKNTDASERKRRIARTVKSVTLIALAAGLVLLAGTEACILSAARGTGSAQDATVIVLGAGLRGDQPSAILRSRLETALDYLTRHPESRAVVCGGQGPDEDYPEAEVMARWLIGRGIAPERIMREDRSHNTRENLENAKQLLDEAGDTGPYLLVSSCSHLYRARQLAAGLGLETETLGAPLPELWLAPAVYLREACSVWLMFVRELM